MSTKPTLGYWPIRAYCQPIRYLLAITGIEYNQVHYPFGPSLKDIGQHWLKEKFTLGLDFPNLPYWIDGELKLTQSMAILKYLARKHELIAKDVKTLAKQEMVEQQFQDYKVEFHHNFHEQRDNYEKTTIVEHLDRVNSYLGDNQWFSPEFNYIDTIAYEILDWFKSFSPETFAKYPRLNEYVTRFENIPAIKKYQNSSEFKNLSIWSPYAHWTTKVGVNYREGYNVM